MSATVGKIFLFFIGLSAFYIFKLLFMASLYLGYGKLLYQSKAQDFYGVIIIFCIYISFKYVGNIKLIQNNTKRRIIYASTIVFGIFSALLSTIFLSIL